jgi:hypothetical protein
VDLDRTVNRTANALAARGVTAGERVVLHSHNSYGFVVACLAMARLGAIVVPVNFMLGADEVAYVLEHSGAIGLIVEDALLPVAGPALAQAGGATAMSVRAVISDEPVDPPEGWEPLAELMAHGDHDEPAAAIGDDDPLALLYWSRDSCPAPRSARRPPSRRGAALPQLIERHGRGAGGAERRRAPGAQVHRRAGLEDPQHVQAARGAAEVGDQHQRRGQDFSSARFRLRVDPRVAGPAVVDGCSGRPSAPTGSLPASALPCRTERPRDRGAGAPSSSRASVRAPDQAHPLVV